MDSEIANVAISGVVKRTALYVFHADTYPHTRTVASDEN